MDFSKQFGGFKGDKKAFLEQRKREKAIKEETRIRTISCQKISSYWRFSRTRALDLQANTVDFQKKFKGVLAAKQRLSVEQHADLSNKLLFAYPVFFDILQYLHDKNCQKNIQIIVDLASILLEASQMPVMNENLFIEAKSKPQGTIHRTYRYIFRLACLSLKLLSTPKVLTPDQANILDKFLVVAQQKVKAIKNPETPRIIFPSRYLIALAAQEGVLIQYAGAKKAVQRGCLSSQTTKKPEILLATLNTSSNLQQIIKNKQKRARIAFEAIAESASTSQKKQSSQHISNLCNKVNNCMQVWGLLDIGQESLGLNLQLLQKFAGVFMNDLEVLINHANNQLKVKEYFSMEVEEAKQQYQESSMEVEGSTQQQKQTTRNLFYKSYSETLSSIDLRQITTDRSVMLFSNMISSLIKSKPLTVNELEKVSQICGQFLMMCRIRNDQQLGIKIKLAQTFGLLSSLFEVFNVLNFDLNRMRTHSKQLSNVVELFCLLLKKRLSLMDDEEFFSSLKLAEGVIVVEESPNFNLQEIKQLIGFLNTFAYRLLFIESISEYKRCENLVVKILKQFYERDSRKKFFDAWILTDSTQNNNNTVLSTFNFKRVDEKNLYMSKLLNRIPHVFTFEQRYMKLKSLIEEDQATQDRNPFQFFQNEDNMLNPLLMNSKNIFIKRGNELNEAFEKFHKKNMKALYKITFVDEHGFIEEGIDGGGIIKEFINSVVRQGFDPTGGLFIETAENTLMPAPNNRNRYARYVFLGQIVGKAIYENILIEPVFSKVFLNQILEKSSSLEDLQYIDKALYKTLMQLKHTKDNVADYGLTFAIDDIFNGTVELKLNGSNIAVTNENKLEYISLYAGYKLHQLNEFEASAFRSGFASVIDQEWLSMFNHDELQLIISGKFTCFDVNDLKAHTMYRGYTANDLNIVMFWQILESFSEQDKAKFLHFVTSCSRPPTLGFKSLNPLFCIQQSIDDSNPNYPDKLPTSSTCMNILKLPNYQDGNKMKSKLLEAIYSGAGFDLS